MGKRNGMNQELSGCSQEHSRISRRSVLGLGAAGALGVWMEGLPGAMPLRVPRLRLADSHVEPRGDTLVVLFLRGGADGLNMVLPHGEDAYYHLRPALAIARPDDNRAETRAVDLDGFFGLHPSLAALYDVYGAGDLAFIHAAGSPDETRSHFEAADLMERGVPSAGEYSGWLARHLNILDTGNDSALRTVALSDMLPASLSGTTCATALQSVGDFHLSGREETREERQELLSELFRQDGGMLAAAAEQTFATMEVIRSVSEAEHNPAGRPFPEGEFGQSLSTVARLIRAGAGVEAACVDLAGWDTHAAQGTSQGLMPHLMEQLAGGLTAFYEDLQDVMDSITVVVMSEFGRRARENAALGTDHGHGNMMMVMGGGIRGGKVFSDWPGLEPEQLVGPGDLAVTTDYRDVLGEILRKRTNNPHVGEIFPGYEVCEIGLAQSRTG